eukprot:2492283-Pyramimonas_sp.AAC.1
MLGALGAQTSRSGTRCLCRFWWVQTYVLSWSRCWSKGPVGGGGLDFAVARDVELQVDVAPPVGVE